MSKRERLDAGLRKEQIIAAALDLAEREHYTKVTRDMVANRLGITGAGVQYHFGTIGRLQEELILAAVAEARLQVVAQALVAQHPAVQGATDDLRRQALFHAAGGGYRVKAVSNGR